MYVWIYLSAILIGGAIGIVVYFLINKVQYDNLPPLSEKFKQNRAKAAQGLIEKKNAQEKEMTEEIRQEQEKLLQSLSIRRNLVAQEMQELDDRKHQKMIEYNQQCNDMLKEYQSFKERLSEKKKASQDDMIKEQTERIASIQAQYDKELADLEKTQSDKVKGMTENFLAYSAEIDMKRVELTKEIEEYEEKQKTIIARFKHDEEVRQQADFYHISIDGTARKDIAQLKSLALQFSKPEVLYKLLYEVYYKALMEELFKRVLGNSKDCGGIYKITNINNQKVYIGKTTKFLDRWRTHAKRGCGIERIKGQLYDALFKEGLENFTWEIVEICNKDQQTEREKYWTTFYKSEEWGYNMKNG